MLGWGSRGSHQIIYGHSILCARNGKDHVPCNWEQPRFHEFQIPLLSTKLPTDKFGGIIFLKITASVSRKIPLQIIDLKITVSVFQATITRFIFNYRKNVCRNYLFKNYRFRFRKNKQLLSWVQEKQLTRARCCGGVWSFCLPNGPRFPFLVFFHPGFDQHIKTALGMSFKGVVLSHLLASLNVESTPYFCRLASIGVLGGKGEGAGWWAWEHSPGNEEVGWLEGVVGEWTSSIRMLKLTPLILI